MTVLYIHTYIYMCVCVCVCACILYYILTAVRNSNSAKQTAFGILFTPNNFISTFFKH